MQPYTEEDLAPLIQPPQSQAAEKPIDQPGFSPPVVYAKPPQPRVASTPTVEQPVEEYDEQEEYEQEYETPNPYRGWRVRSILLIAWNLFGMAAAWTVVGWACCLPFVGSTLYTLLMAPGTIGLSAMIYFIYFAYWRGLSLARLELAFQIIAMHSIVHDLCRLWFNDFPKA